MKHYILTIVLFTCLSCGRQDKKPASTGGYVTTLPENAHEVQHGIARVYECMRCIGRNVDDIWRSDGEDAVVDKIRNRTA